MPDNLNEHFLAHDFPPAFPVGFTPDTAYFYQAIEEHNRERMQCGLPAQNFSQLSPGERHDVLCRANTIKLLSVAELYQAIEEHNRERMQCGLPAQNFSQLSPGERHDVLCRANTIKLLSVAEVFGLPPRPLPVALAAPKNEKEREMALLEGEGKHFNVLGWVFLLAGISSFLVMVIQILK